MGKNRRKRRMIHQHHREEPETEKEIIDRLRELEYIRITLGHYPSPRRAIYEDGITKEIKRLENKLEGMRNEQTKS